MLSLPSSSAAVLVNPRTAHLLDTYAASPNVAVNPAPEEILTIAPPPALRIEGATARIPRYAPVTLTSSTWRQVIDINLTGAYLGIRAVASSMRKAGGGAIVNISSGAGFTATFGLAAYVASKWGVRGLTKTAALELGRDNIRVNSIHPGAIRTPILADHAPDAAAMAATMAGAGVGLSAIPRIAEPDEITRMVLFVASGEASFSTGSEFIADGGLLLGPVPNSRPRA